MSKPKCITFDKEAQDNLPQHIKDKMKADRERARKKKRTCTNSKGGMLQKCITLGCDLCNDYR